MGSSVSWFAAQKEIPKVFLSKLQNRLEEVRKRQVASFIEHNSRQKMGTDWITEGKVVNVLRFPPNWQYAIVERGDVIRTASDLLIELSSDAEVVACFVEEHVMYSSSAFWSNSKLLWSASYDSNRNVDADETRGNISEQFKTRIDSAKEKYRKTLEIGNLFDIPVSLAESIAGIRYDRLSFYRGR